jgi:hypothetical protein
MIAHPVTVAVDSLVTATRDGDDVAVVVQFRPFGEQLPGRFGSVRAVTATREDAKHTKLPVRSVRVEHDRLHVAVAAGGAQRFTLHFAGVAHGGDSVAVSLLDDAAFDPKESTAADEPDATRTLVDYLSKDFRSFKRLMLDSIAHKAPGFVEQHEADAAIALIDVLAFAADSLSYYQDAVATEAYLETARRRVSVRRHARLLGYTLSEGCTPRVWLHVEPKVAFKLTRDFKARAAVDDRGFQPLADVCLDPAIHRMSLSVDGGDIGTLRKGATAATLVRDGREPSRALVRGSVLIFEEGPDPATGMPPQLRNRQAVRLDANPIDSAHPSQPGKRITRVTWWPEDALAFDLRARSAIVRGNIVPADYGDTQEEFPLPAAAFSVANATLRVALTDLTFAVPYVSDEPAKAFTELDPRAAVASRLKIKATSFDEQLEWVPKADLIAADRSERVFVVEVERSGAVLLRFGDGTNGERPDPSSRFTLCYRQGSGVAGHVGANTITEFVDVSDPRAVVSVTNPLPSAGGQPPEEIAQAKRWAPDEVRVQRHCITEDDYERVAQGVSGVTAYARRRWTGDRETVDVYVDAPRDLQRTLARVRAVLASARLIGADVVVHPPRRVPVAVKLRIVCTPDAQPPEVERNVRANLQTALDKRHLTLGSTLFASWLIVAARDVAGVADVELRTFARWGGPDRRRDGFIEVGPAELAVFVDETGTTTNGLPVIEAGGES